MSDYGDSRESFKQAMQQAVRDYPGRIRFIDRLRLNVALRRHPEVVEEYCVEMGLKLGAIKPGDVGDDGLLVRDWQSFFQMLLDNLPAILEFISGLFAIFSMFSIVLAAGLTLSILAGTAQAQCSNGTCQPIRKTVSVLVNRPVVQAAQKTVVRTRQAVRQQRVRLFRRRR